MFCVGCQFSGVGCWVSGVGVGCRASGGGCQVSGVDCWVSDCLVLVLVLVVSCRRLSVGNCGGQVLTTLG